MEAILYIVVLLVYFAVMIFIGIRSSRSSRSVQGFVLGGRSVGPWLSAFAYGTSYFSAVICGAMVTHSKPHPEIYERACEALAIEPGEALVLEDSRNGIRAGLAAGASVIWIPDLVTELPQEEPYLTARFEHLGQVARWMARIRTAPAKI